MGMFKGPSNKKKFSENHTTVVMRCWSNSVFPKLVDADTLLRSRVSDVEVCTSLSLCKDSTKDYWLYNVKSLEHHCAFGWE